MTAPGERIRGRVVSFDAEVGLGEVQAEGATHERIPFHCTRLADGSRTIESGAAVTFSLITARWGRWEAADIARL